jgi:hypothetical protein
MQTQSGRAEIRAAFSVRKRQKKPPKETCSDAVSFGILPRRPWEEGIMGEPFGRFNHAVFLFRISIWRAKRNTAAGGNQTNTAAE